MAPEPSADWAADCLHWRGRLLTGERAHWCFAWDGLPVDETCREFRTCDCFPPVLGNCGSGFRDVGGFVPGRED